VADATLLATETYEQVQLLLPRGITVVEGTTHGGAYRYKIRGNDLVDGQGYQLVSTDGPFMRCIELVENPVPEDVVQSGQPQPQKEPA
jgi:hypothetical protein